MVHISSIRVFSLSKKCWRHHKKVPYIECQNRMRTRLDNQVHQPAGCAEKDARQPEIARIAFPLVNLLSCEVNPTLKTARSSARGEVRVSCVKPARLAIKILFLSPPKRTSCRGHVNVVFKEKKKRN